MNDDYRMKLDAARPYQDHVAEWFVRMGIPLTVWNTAKNQAERGESYQGVEIKLDRRFRETGNLFIECEERSDAESSEWHPSGIMAEHDNLWAVCIGDYKAAWVLSVRFLRCLKNTGRYTWREIDRGKGFLLPISDATKYAIFFLPPPILDMPQLGNGHDY